MPPDHDLTNAPHSTTGGVYLHIPFCRSKCFYCDFYSLAGRDDAIDRFTACLEQELRQSAEHPPTWSVDTVYIGGGTPNLLPPAAVERLLRVLDDALGLGAATEITIEANPGLADATRWGDLRGLGVNRLSLGMQSFDPAILDFLQRLHRPEDRESTFAAARTAGFDNINVDLIFNVPGQSLAGWEADLRIALALAPEHISAYSLTVEPETGLARAVAAGEVAMPPEELDHDMFAATRDILGAGGYAAYEISNFAREGWACRHNLHYWRIEPYLGCGPAAHGFDGRRRYWNVRDLDEYLVRIEAGEAPLDGSEILTDDQLASEKLLFGLRLAEGVSIVDGLGFESVEAFQRRFAGPLERWSGKVEINAGRLRTTAAGVFLADGITADFMQLL